MRRPALVVGLVVGLVGVLVVVAALLTGAAVPADRTVLRVAGPAAPAAADTILPVVAGGVAVRHVGVADSQTRVDDETVAAVLTDVSAFWAAALPTAFGHPFVPLAGGYVSIDATAATGSGPCVSTPDQIAGNAYYCPGEDAIVFDSAGLVPVLLGHYGVAGLTASFAHEFGHAIQARIGPTATQRAAAPASFPSLLIEAQGDCYAGAFLAWAVAGHAAHVRLTESSMVRAVAPLLDFRDPVSTAAADPTAHGLGVDRLSDLLRGYRGGPSACHGLTRASLHPTLGRPRLLTAAAPDRFATTAAAVRAARASVASFAAAVHAGTAAVRGALRGLASVRPLPADLAAAAPYGQFADAAAGALAAGRLLTGNGDGAACFVGAWVQSVYGRAAAGQLGSWAGDADEALDMLRARPDADFTELTAYADGFARGWAACGS